MNHNQKYTNKNLLKKTITFNLTYNLPSDGSWSTTIFNKLCDEVLDKTQKPHNPCNSQYLSEKDNKILFKCQCS